MVASLPVSAAIMVDLVSMLVTHLLSLHLSKHFLPNAGLNLTLHSFARFRFVKPHHGGTFADTLDRPFAESLSVYALHHLWGQLGMQLIVGHPQGIFASLDHMDAVNFGESSGAVCVDWRLVGQRVVVGRQRWRSVRRRELLRGHNSGLLSQVLPDDWG